MSAREDRVRVREELEDLLDELGAGLSSEDELDTLRDKLNTIASVLSHHMLRRTEERQARSLPSVLGLLERRTRHKAEKKQLGEMESLADEVYEYAKRAAYDSITGDEFRRARRALENLTEKLIKWLETD
jgi:hypothetical protein